MGRIEKEEYIIGSISLLANKFSQFGDGIHKDITSKQWFLLLMMSKMEDEEKTLNSVAEFVGTTRQNVKKMITQLEEKKYVKIKPSKYDARAMNITLTKKTQNYFDKHYPEVSKKTDELFSKISEAKLDSIVKGLAALAECFDEEE